MSPKHMHPKHMQTHANIERVKALVCAEYVEEDRVEATWYKPEEATGLC